MGACRRSSKDADILDAGVEFTSSPTGQLDVLMSSNGGEVEGVVLNADDQPAKVAAVELVPDEPNRARSRLYRQASTTSTPAGYLSVIKRPKLHDKSRP